MKQSNVLNKPVYNPEHVPSKHHKGNLQYCYVTSDQMSVTLIPQYTKASTSVFKMGRFMYYSIKVHASVV
jgi:hypothetical protein